MDPQQAFKQAHQAFLRAGAKGVPLADMEIAFRQLNRVAAAGVAANQELLVLLTDATNEMRRRRQAHQAAKVKTDAPDVDMDAVDLTRIESILYKLAEAIARNNQWNFNASAPIHAQLETEVKHAYRFLALLISRAQQTEHIQQTRSRLNARYKSYQETFQAAQNPDWLAVRVWCDRLNEHVFQMEHTHVDDNEETLRVECERGLELISQIMRIYETATLTIYQKNMIDTKVKNLHTRMNIIIAIKEETIDAVLNEQKHKQDAINNKIRQDAINDEKTLVKGWTIVLTLLSWYYWSDLSVSWLILIAVILYKFVVPMFLKIYRDFQS